MSKPPCSAVTWRYMSLTEARSVTSTRMALAPNSLAVAVAWSKSISAMMTVAPASRSEATMPRPMPEAPPVTTATRPVRSNMMLLFLKGVG